MRKTTTFLSLLVILSGLASASWGVIPFQTEAETSELSHEFRLGFVNTGKGPLSIDISADLPRGYVLEAPGSFILQPSRTASIPKGSGWYYRNGRYVKISYREFEVRATEKRRTNNIDFTVSVAATPAAELKGGTRPVLRRNLDYSLEFNRPMIVGKNREGKRERKTVPDQPEQQERQEDNGPGNTEKEQDRNSTQNPAKGNKGADNLTLILAGGVVLTALYLIKVI